MKKAILFFFASFLVTFLSAQTCQPDTAFIDAEPGVFPLPFSDNEPDGGIPFPACINEPFEFVITIKVPEQVPLGGFQVNVDSVLIDTIGAVQNLPDGMDYACNPPNCIFIPGGDTLSCLLVFGTPNNPADIGTSDIIVNAIAFNDFIPALPITLPDNTGIFPGAEGNYFLELREEGDCMTTNTRDYLNEQLSLENSPNPFGYETVIEVNSLSREDLDFEVFDLLGQRIYLEKVLIQPGTNQIPFDGSQLQNGIYNYSFSNGESRVSNKMVVLK